MYTRYNLVHWTQQKATNYNDELHFLEELPRRLTMAMSKLLKVNNNSKSSMSNGDVEVYRTRVLLFTFSYD